MSKIKKGKLYYCSSKSKMYETTLMSFLRAK